MLVDFSLGTFTSDGEGIEEDGSGLFCILSMRSVFIAVPKNKLWLRIPVSEVRTFSHFQNLPFITIFER
jgi:hypothetical protein